MARTIVFVKVADFFCLEVNQQLPLGYAAVAAVAGARGPHTRCFGDGYAVGISESSYLYGRGASQAGTGRVTGHDFGGY